MLLRKVTVEHWRGLSGSIGPFSDALNLIAGPNESGKSRYFQAIRFALTQSYRGQNAARRALQSWNSNEPPKVVVEFERAGHSYVLTKQYLTRSFAQLEGEGRTLKDRDAEDWLRTLISTGQTVIDDDLGAWPLLLVEQGSSRLNSSATLNTATRNDLTSQLSGELEIAAVSTSTASLMNRVESEWSKYFTATGRENRAFVERRERVAELEAQYQEAQHAYAEQQRLADTLALARQDYEGYAQRLATASDNLAEAQSTADAVNSVKVQLDEAKEALETRTASRDDVANQIERRSIIAQKVAELTETLSEKQGRFDAKEAEFQRAKLALEAARTHLTESLAAYEGAETAGNEAREIQRHRELSNERDRIAALVVRLSERHDTLSDLRQQLASLATVTQDDLASLQQKSNELATLRVQLEASAIELSITAHQTLMVDDEALDAGSTRDIKITGDQELQLGGVATLAIKANSQSLESLTSSIDDLERTLRAELSRLGVKTQHEAEQVVRGRQDLEQKIHRNRVEIEALSDKPLQELIDHAAGLDSQLEGVESDDQFDVDAALQRERNALETLNQHRAIKDGAQETVDKLRPARDTLASELQSLKHDISLEQQRLADQPTADVLERSLSEHESALSDAQETLARLAAEFEALGGAEVTESIDRLERAVKQLEDKREDQKSDVRRLEGQLEHVMGNGSYEQLANCDTGLALARAELSRIEQAAMAADRLKTVFERHRTEVVDRLLQPVKDRVRPYLRFVFPQSEPLTDDNMDFTGLNVGNQQEPFGALSGGAQEQFALMTRLGLAEVLAEDERLPLLLDDSLINSDASRIARVHSALDRASQHLQIIVFTCHEPFFDGLGAQYQVKLTPTR